LFQTDLILLCSYVDAYALYENLFIFCVLVAVFICVLHHVMKLE